MGRASVRPQSNDASYGAVTCTLVAFCALAQPAAGRLIDAKVPTRDANVRTLNVAAEAGVNPATSETLTTPAGAAEPNVAAPVTAIWSKRLSCPT